MPPQEPQNTSAHCIYTLEREQIPARLDPELQNAILAARSDTFTGTTVSPPDIGDAFVDVLGRLKDPAGAVPAEISDIQKAGEVITGRVKVRDIVRARAHGNILSLKGGRKIYETLDSSVSEINASRPQLRASFPGKVFDGAGVIVGVVDHGCDFAHPNFRNERGTRILYLWDQKESSEDHPPPRGFRDGREFDARAIDRALEVAAPECYERLGYQPQSAHGTRVLDIAAGSGMDVNPAGVAPGAGIIFVDVADDDVSAEEPLGNSVHLFQAVKYIFDKAEELSKQDGVPRPVVVNVSLNSDGGPHDGSTPFERGVDYLLETPGRAVVIAAGNSAGQEPCENRHAGGTLRPSQTVRLPWHIGSGDKTDNKVEIWYGGAHEIELSLISPGGEPLQFFPLGTTTSVYCSGKSVARVFHRRHDPNNHDNQILIIFSTEMEPGTWLIMLRSLSSTPFTFHAWVETDGRPRPGFLAPPASDEAYTIGSIACGYSTIAVGAYFTAAPNDILPQSAEGPTRDGRLKPEISAPGATCPPGSSKGGAGIRAANILRGNSTQADGGTSAAAPHVTGLIAQLMKGALPTLLPVETIRELVIQEAQRTPPAGDSAWHPRFGRGRVDALASLSRQAFPPREEVCGDTINPVAAPQGASNNEDVTPAVGDANIANEVASEQGLT
jgi:subtilisin family serine protease